MDFDPFMIHKDLHDLLCAFDPYFVPDIPGGQ